MRRSSLPAGAAALFLAFAAASLGAQSVDPAAKPQAPTVPHSLVTGRAPADCADEKVRAAIVADMNKEMPSVLQFAEDANAYTRALMEWKSARLRRAGWTKEDESKMGRDLLANAAFKTEFEKGLGELQGLIQVLPTLIESDDQAMCQGAFAVQARFDGLVRHTMAQWKIIADALEAEARRLGTSFE